MSIAQPLFNPDDPRLTAYALGELSDPAERAQVEQLLAASPEARAELADLRALTTALTAEYDAERAAASAEETPANVVAMTPAAPKPSVFRRFSPWWQVAAVLMLAALGIYALPVYEMRQERLASVASARPANQQATAAFALPSSGSTTAAPTPGSPLLAANTAAQPPAEPDVRELVVPPGAPLPSVPPGTTAVYGPAPVTGVVGGNPRSTIDADSARLDSSFSDKSRLALDATAGKQVVRAAPATSDKFLGSVPTGDINAGRDVTAGFADVHIPVATLSKPAPPSARQEPINGTDAGSGRGGMMDVAQAPAAPPVVSSPRKSFASSWASPKDSLAQTPPPARAKAGIVSSAPSSASSARRQEARDHKGGEEVLSVLTAQTPAISSGGGNITSVAVPTDDVNSSALNGEETAPFSGRRLSDAKKEDQPNTAQYTHTTENPFLGAKENPLSTFSIDVDTASYAITRRFIESGSLPPPDAVRIEEMINYFPYADAPPAPGNDKPFAIHLEAAACPWDTTHRLVRVGIKGREMDQDKRPPSNLVFLLDVSGSMEPEERLPLVKKSLRLLVERLREDDRVSIVVYAGASGLVLPPTTGDHKDTILRSIETLRPGGSTNGASGIKLAYNMARKGFRKDGTNRVILATDGDFNVGVTNQGDLLRLIEDERKDGIFLSVLGVGTDNLKDSTMQTLADHGNGNYNYIDRLEEGRKVLVNQMSGTLVTIAKDVKIQVEFNPAAVSSYRLIGYEKRLLKKEDFNNDKIDAGEIGAGHSVTALYEVVPAGQPTPGAVPPVDALKYQQPPAPDVRPTGSAPVIAPEDSRAVAARELLTVKMRHKAPDSDTSEKSYEVALLDSGAPGAYSNATPDFQFSAAVASFGMLLRNSPYKGESSFGGILELAQAGRGEDPNGYRAGFIELVREARGIQRNDR